MKCNFFILFFVLFYEAASGQTYRQQENLYYEFPDSTNLKNHNFFNLDNTIYKPGKEFKFSYQIIKNGDTLLVRVDKPGDTKTPDWSFVKSRNADTLTIQYLSFKILDGYGGLDDLFPDYSQTVIQQKYYSTSGLLFDGLTGIIENRYNIWLHPFRGKYFSILEFSPFPYIRFPAKANVRWTWKLNDISERWSDKRIIEYAGKQHAINKYKIIRKKILNTALGMLDCFVTEATAITSLGTTKLTTWFNKEYGFVAFHYFNIDKSMIEINLIEVKQ